MGSQYLLANNESPDAISEFLNWNNTMQFEFVLEIPKTVHKIPTRFCSIFLKIVKIEFIWRT